MRVAVAGVCNGDLDRVFDACRRLEKQGLGLDLLICCGDLQSVRDENDLESLNVPEQWRKMKDFHKYYSGEKQAPVTTVFIGGRNEVSTLLREHYFGGWVAPRIYYLGYAGVVRVGPLRIAGVSGFFAGSDYFRGHSECPPLTEEMRRSILHVREWDVARLEKLQEPVDIVVSYDWPRGIWKFGKYEEMFEQQDLSGDLKREMDGNTLGSPAAMELLKKLKPSFWFASNLMVKFPAVVPHGDGTFTRFLALDRPRKDFLQVLDIDPTSPSCMRQLPEPNWQRRGFPRPKVPLCYDPEWLAIQKVNHKNMTFSWKMEKAKIDTPSKDDIAWVAGRLKEAVGSLPRLKASSKRHPKLLATKLRQAAGEGKQNFRNFSTLQLREHFETRGLEFPGHLDKASMVKQLEEFDEFFVDDEAADGAKETEAYPIPDSFARDHGNPACQRASLLETLELDDPWKEQEEQRRLLTKTNDKKEKDYDPFNDSRAAEEEAEEEAEEQEQDQAEGDAEAEEQDQAEGDAEAEEQDQAEGDAEAEEQDQAENDAEAEEQGQAEGDAEAEEQGQAECEAEAEEQGQAEGDEEVAQADANEDYLNDADLQASAQALASAMMGLGSEEEAEAVEPDGAGPEQVEAAEDAEEQGDDAAAMNPDEPIFEDGVLEAQTGPMVEISAEIAEAPEPEEDEYEFVDIDDADQDVHAATDNAGVLHPHGGLLDDETNIGELADPRIHALAEVPRQDCTEFAEPAEPALAEGPMAHGDLGTEDDVDPDVAAIGSVLEQTQADIDALTAALAETEADEADMLPDVEVEEAEEENVELAEGEEEEAEVEEAFAETEVQEGQAEVQEGRPPSKRVRLRY